MPATNACVDGINPGAQVPFSAEIAQGAGAVICNPDGSITITGSTLLIRAALAALLTLGDAVNVAVGTTTGTKIGTATTQKLSFFNATPVVQPAGTGNVHTVAAGSVTGVFVNTTFDGSVGATAYTIGDIVAALKAVGLLA